LGRVEIGLDLLSGYAPAKDETEIPPRSAVIIYSGFTEWLALPGDVKSDRAADLLTYACQQAGLRPGAWLLPEETAIFSAQVDSAREGFRGGQ
jgi:AMMECR1 domain-containing protein